ncbi:hypothetical protein RHGRI_033437 [Rhododendron griersonianum]|uniref:Uncharacterized protein n=1 Tax=Rhododendron griersonianum TaxID=479676 RepID=A0AAV6I015_9ERIC|nr:hypothetical protein RHGRI_033437 [Rhododendron griersonianum]
MSANTAPDSPLGREILRHQNAAALTDSSPPQRIARDRRSHSKIQPLRDGNIRADGRDHHAIHVPEEIQRIGAMTRKQKATYVGSGKENSEIQPLGDRNVRAEIRDGRDHHVVHVHEEIQRIGAMARKRKATYVGSGKENSEVSHVDTCLLAFI